MTGTDRLVRSTSSPTVDFYLSADEISTNAGANTSVVRAYLRAVNRGNTSTFYNGTGASVTATVNGFGFGVSGNDAKLASGHANGAVFWEYGPYDITVPHDAGGGKTVVLELNVSYPSVSGGGYTSGSMGLSQLTVAPGVPSGLSFARVSDTQANLGWTNNGASNGQPTSNQVRTSVNGAAYTQVASIAAATSLGVTVAANQKIVAQVQESNAAGAGGWSADSPAVFTTPAAPTSVAAAKDASGNIVVTWVDNVPFAEHAHVVQAASSTDGGTTWSGWSTLTSAATGGTYTHTAPDASKLWKYQVQAKNTDTGALTSAFVTSNTVQLLAAPNKPTVPALNPYQAADLDFVLHWAHNPVDSTPQSHYEVETVVNGGSPTTTGKVTSAVQSKTFTANTYDSADTVRFRVRTWGSATTGGADGAGASPWSDPQTVTFKSAPTVTIDSPEDPWGQSQVVVDLGFAQGEGASFVRATLTLSQGATVLEQKLTTGLTGTTLATHVVNGQSYTLTVTVTDSNGVVSAPATLDFDVAYTLPVAADVDAVYSNVTGRTQITISIPAPGDDESAAVSATITRTIDGVTDTIVDHYPVPVPVVIDTTPTIHGDNVYTVTTFSEDGAANVTVFTLTILETDWAFLATGPGFATVIRFGSNLKTTVSEAREAALVATAGRQKPIALFGDQRSMSVDGSASLQGASSTPAEVRQFLRDAGIVCYREPSGLRMFGRVTGSVGIEWTESADFSFSLTEAI